MTKRILHILSILSIFFCSVCNASEIKNEEGTVFRAIVENGDTILVAGLPNLYVFPPLKFKNEKQEKFYWRTVRDVKRTLPWAKLIGSMLKDLHAQMEGMSDKEKKAFMKQKEDEIYKQYEPMLKKLTLRQGKMLITLVDRECDMTGYEIVKELRGGFRAFFWQGFAKILGADLKSGFDETKEEHQIVNRIILLVESGQL